MMSQFKIKNLKLKIVEYFKTGKRKWIPTFVGMTNSILILIFVLNCVYAQETDKVVLTSGKSIEFALQNNKNILIAGEKINQARGKIVEARSGYFPSLSIQGSYTRLSMVPALSLSLPVGPTVINKEMVLGSEDNYLARAALQQTLFSWWKVSDSYSLSRLSLKLAEESYNQTTAETILNVTKAFYGVILASNVYEANEEMLERAQEHLRAVEDKYKVGNASQFELLRARVQVANTKPAVSKSKNTLEVSVIALKNLLGMDLSAEIELAGELTFVPQEFSQNKSIEDAFENRPELKQLKLKKEISKKSRSIASAGDKPSLIAIANYNYQNPFYYQIDWVNNWSAGLVLNYPIFDGFNANGKARQANSDLNQTGIQIEQAKNNIEMEVRQTYLSLQEAKDRIISQEENVKQAEESLKIAEVSYTNGVATNLEVMDTQLALTQAKINYLQALYDYITTVAAMKKAVGRIK